MVDFTLKTANGTTLNLSNLSRAVEIRIPRPKEAAVDIEAAEQHFVKVGDTQNHTFSVPLDDVPVFLTIKPNHRRSVIIRVSPLAGPNAGKPTLTITLPNQTLCENSVALNCSRDSYTFPVSSGMTGASGLHKVAVELLDSNVSSGEERPRSRRDCGGHNGRRKRSCIGVKDPPTTVPPTTKILIRPTYNATTDRNYTFSVNVPSCQYWSNQENKWTDEGCTVSYAILVHATQVNSALRTT